MSNARKYEEHGTIKCEKCDCLLVSDSFGGKKGYAAKESCACFMGEGDSSHEAIILERTFSSNVKIVVRSTHQDDTSPSESATSIKKDTTISKGETENSGVWYKFCRKKKKPDADSKNKNTTPEPPKTNKTDKGHKPQEKKPIKPINVGNQTTDSDIIEILKQRCSTCGKGGGTCNNNTIIFPRGQSGDGASNLENMLTLEAKMQTRNMEEILSEIQRQRREIAELKEMLDMVVRTMRDHLYMSAFIKGKDDVFPKEKKKMNLERKSNTLSLDKDESSPNNTALGKKKSTSKAPAAPDETKKRKGLFNWCSRRGKNDDSNEDKGDKKKDESKKDSKKEKNDKSAKGKSQTSLSKDDKKKSQTRSPASDPNKPKQKIDKAKDKEREKKMKEKEKENKIKAKEREKKIKDKEKEKQLKAKLAADKKKQKGKSSPPSSKGSTKPKKQKPKIKKKRKLFCRCNK